MMTYISEEPACLAQILRDYRQKLAAIETFARQHPVRRILLLATGSSLNAALCARYFFEQRFGVLVEIKEPYNFTHYEAVDPHTDLVVAISQSGKSASTLAAMRKVQALSLPVFALTSDPQSPIARACDGILDINTGIESVGFVTRGFSATVLNLLLMALMIARARESQRGRGAALSCRTAAAGGGDPGCYCPHLAVYRQAWRSAAGRRALCRHRLWRAGGRGEGVRNQIYRDGARAFQRF
jgi:glucosamine 6-phosphate synthetase-like amidotransferase/phosphosugar isomerase protein